MDLRLALELYTVRRETAGDFAGTVRKVAEMGYPAVEFAGYGGLSAVEMAALLAETGMEAAATHVGIDTLTSNLDGEIDYCISIGCRYLVVPGLSPNDRHDPEALASRFNRLGQRCRQRGIIFGYHNHDWEFAGQAGDRFLDRLLDATSPDLVVLELDVYWAAYAGVDPVAVLRRYQDRIPLVHLKDMSTERRFAEVGEGTLDIPAICIAAADAGTQWYIVENDEPRIPPLESARVSLENLHRMQR